MHQKMKEKWSSGTNKLNSANSFNSVSSKLSRVRDKPVLKAFSKGQQGWEYGRNDVPEGRHCSRKGTLPGSFQMTLPGACFF